MSLVMITVVILAGVAGLFVVVKAGLWAAERWLRASSERAADKGDRRDRAALTRVLDRIGKPELARTVGARGARQSLAHPATRDGTVRPAVAREQASAGPVRPLSDRACGVTPARSGFGAPHSLGRASDSAAVQRVRTGP